MIGTGSSAIQSIPIIAQQAKHLTVFQRTANYTVPAHNAPLDPDYVREVKADYPAMRKRAKSTPPGIDFKINMASAIATPEAERQREFQERWDYGGLGFMASFSDLLLNDESNKTAAEFVRAKIREVVKDPELADRLSPRNVIGCKRLCVDTGYWATFNQPHVTLVDVSDTPIERITADGPARQRQGLHLRLPGAGDRLRRHDRRAAADRHPRPRRPQPAGQVDRGTEDLSRPHHGGLPQPLHHHRPGQPVGADQHAAVDRAARRMDRRLHRIRALARRHA